RFGDGDGGGGGAREDRWRGRASPTRWQARRRRGRGREAARRRVRAARAHGRRAPPWSRGTPLHVPAGDARAPLPSTPARERSYPELRQCPGVVVRIRLALEFQEEPIVVPHVEAVHLAEHV